MRNLLRMLSLTLVTPLALAMALQPGGSPVIPALVLVSALALAVVALAAVGRHPQPIPLRPGSHRSGLVDAEPAPAHPTTSGRPRPRAPGREAEAG